MTLYTSSFNDYNNWPIITDQVINHLFNTIKKQKTDPNLTRGCIHLWVIEEYSKYQFKRRKLFAVKPRITFSFYLSRIICLFRFLSCCSWRFCRGHSSLASFSSAWLCIPLQQHDCHISVRHTALSDFHRDTWGPCVWKWPVLTCWHQSAQME